MNEPLPRYEIRPVDQCDPEVGRWIATLIDARERTLEELGNIADALFDRPPPVGVNTVGTLLYHLAATDLIWGYERFAKRPIPAELNPLFPTVELTGGRLYEPNGLSTDDYQERLSLTREHLIGLLMPLSVEELRKVRLVEADFGTFEITGEAMINHLVQHESEHRGQLGLLRRAMV